MNKKIEIIITDDHPFVREGIRSFLENYSEFRIVGEAENGLELLNLLKIQNADIVLLDHQMPVMEGRETLKEIKKLHSKIKVIIVSLYDDNSLLVDYYRRGADGFYCKSSQAFLLAESIKKVYYNGSGYTEEKLNIITKCLGEGHFQFTSREIEILELLCSGYSTKKMAEKIFRSESAVNNHVSHLYEKTGTENIAGLVAYAINSGLVLKKQNDLSPPPPAITEDKEIEKEEEILI